MKTVTDRYDGVTVDSSTFPKNKEEFESEIKSIIETLKDKKLLWIKIPVEKSDFIPILTNLGFVFHHCDENELMLIKKLIKNPIIPPARNCTLGVGAIVRNEDKLLLIKDKFNVGYKLPGGHVDDNESIKNAMKREVYEETGIKVEFESIVNVGHFIKGQFGESVLYVVCTAKPITKEINIYDSHEVIEAKWIDIDEVLAFEDINSYNKNVIKAALDNKELKLTEQNISLKVPGEVFF